MLRPATAHNQQLTSTSTYVKRSTGVSWALYCVCIIISYILLQTFCFAMHAFKNYFFAFKVTRTCFYLNQRDALADTEAMETNKGIGNVF